MKIANLEVNNTYTITLVVASAVARETKAKKPYLQLTLFDGVDTITGNYWDWTSGNIPPKNAILDVHAQVTEWQGTKQLNIKRLSANTSMVLAEFTPQATQDLSDIYKNAYELMSGVPDNFLSSLAMLLLEELRDLWLTAPGAVSVHHAYVGGTLVHSYSVANLARNMAIAIPEADASLCTVGGMLHDIGKLYAYRVNGLSMEMTGEGQLYDHTFIGAEFIGNFIESNFDADSPDVTGKTRLLRHIILSHHGQLEYGAAVTPRCLEAYIVSAADNLDATAEQIRAASAKVPGKDMTERIFTLSNKPHLTPSFVSELMEK